MESPGSGRTLCELLLRQGQHRELPAVTPSATVSASHPPPDTLLSLSPVFHKLRPSLTYRE
jgi:hypothetical protein